MTAAQTEDPGTRGGTRARIIEVAARLLREDGPAAVTTRGVATAAGVQAPTIYRLFGDKDGLLEAVAEHVMTDFVWAKAAAVDAAAADGVDPLDDLHTGWIKQIEFGVANPTLFRLLSDPDRVRHSAAARSGRAVLESRVHRVALTGRLRVSEQRAVDLIQAAGIGAIQTLLSRPPDSRNLTLGEAMYDAVLAHILTGAPTRADDHSIATTVAFRALAPQLTMLSDGERHLLSEWLGRAVNDLSDSKPAPGA